MLRAGCYDALSAKVLCAAGHSAAFVSGYAVSADVQKQCSYDSYHSCYPIDTMVAAASAQLLNCCF